MLSLLGQLWRSRAESHQSNSNGGTRLKEQDNSVFRRYWSLKIVSKGRRKAYFKSSKASESRLNGRELSQRGGYQHHRPEHTAQEKRDCVVCADTRSVHHFPSRPPAPECEHQADVCKRCLRTWIDVQYQTQMWNDIKCPTCSSLLTLSNI